MDLENSVAVLLVSHCSLVMLALALALALAVGSYWEVLNWVCDDERMLVNVMVLEMVVVVWVLAVGYVM
eukprot:4675871-Ditylum_brightwellii.AAC.1